MDGFEILWRTGNLMLAAIAVFLLVYHYSEIWHRLNKADRFIGEAFVLLVGNVAYSSVETMLQNNPVGVRTGITTVALAALLYGLMLAYRHAHADHDH